MTASELAKEWRIVARDLDVFESERLPAVCVHPDEFKKRLLDTAACIERLVEVGRRAREFRACVYAPPNEAPPLSPSKSALDRALAAAAADLEDET